MRAIKAKIVVVSILIAVTVSFMPSSKVMALEKNTLAKGLQNANQEAILENDSNIRLQDDFYEAINGEWLKTAKNNINPLLRENSYISDLYEQSNKDVKNLFNDLLNNANQHGENTDEKKIINLYNNIINVKARNEQGIEPIKKYLDKIESINTIDDLTKVFSNREMDIFNNLIQFNVINSFNDKQTHELSIMPTILGLGNADVYTIDSYENKEKKKEYVNYLKKLLVLSGFSDSDAKDKIDNLINFEEKIAESMLGLKQATAEGGINLNEYNVPVTISKLNEIAPNLNLPTIMNGLGVDKSNKIVVQQMNWLKKLNELYTEENLPLIKNYIEMTVFQATTMFLTEDLNKANEDYIEYLEGKDAKKITLEEEAYDIVNKKFTMTIGKVYANKYFTQAEKQDVESLTKEVIETYKKRIQNNNWISDETKKNALEKLNKMSINIAYPDNYSDYSNIEVKSYEQGGSLLSNMMNLTMLSRQKELNSVNEPIKKTIFSDKFPPQGVTAEYHFNINGIIISAGILQPDFYKIDKTKEQKLATIGFIIAHEVSHALDELGAMYDADGNLKKWWSEEDYNKFKEKTHRVMNFYSNIEVLPNQYINGQNTLGENIADIGAMACLLDILENMQNANYKEFFESYADGYRCARTSEYQQELLNIDTHSPYKFRVNAVLQQFEKFYQTYGITENDKMYIKPEDRVQIW